MPVTSDTEMTTETEAIVQQPAQRASRNRRLLIGVVACTALIAAVATVAATKSGGSARQAVYVSKYSPQWSTGCRNYDKLQIKFVHMSREECHHLCRNTTGCAAFNYRASGDCGAESCYLFKKGCEWAEDRCWDYFTIEAPVDAEADAEADADADAGAGAGAGAGEDAGGGGVGWQLLSCDTRRHEDSWQTKGQRAIRTSNLCNGVSWNGFKTKVDIYLNHARELHSRGSTDLIVFADSFDVAFGGCTDEELLQRYHQVVQASDGATVIGSAELNFFPKSSGQFPYEDFEERRKKMLEAFGMDVNSYYSYTSQNTPGQYRFANSGWLMGPAGDLATVLSCMLQKGWIGGHFDDQAALHRCLFEHRNLITLDYSGTMVLNLFGFGTSGSKVLDKDGVVKNSAAGGATQCFFHGNGGSYSDWFPLIL